MPKYETEGVIKHLFETQTFASGFAKREFVIETNEGKYPQLLKFEVVKDKIEQLNSVSVGSAVTVHFDIRGSEYKDRFYVQLNAWKIEPGAPPQHSQHQGGHSQPRANQGATAGSGGQDEEDDIPF